MSVNGSPRTTLAPGWRPAGWSDTGTVTAGTQDLDAADQLSAVDLDDLAAVDLERLRAAVAAALEGFLATQRRTLTGMDAALTAITEEMSALARGGKRLRPAFAYWGWRGATADAGGPPEDEAAVLRAVAALEFVHVSALVHDDVMDGASTRRGRPATHLGFASRHDEHALDGDPAAFGVGAAILVGDLALVWSDELLRCSG